MRDSRDEEHEAYASFRGDKYVYVTANEQNEVAIGTYVDGEENRPLVIVGSSGIGKTSLLSNWFRQRQDNTVDWKHDFLFAHFVGCSPESYSLQCMLLRLESSLKSFFNLRKMEIPESEERLRWSLFRFLNAAASAGMNNVCSCYVPKIIIIIDGANLLRNQDTQPGALHWLPINLPECVRFILSTVELDDNRSDEGTSSSISISNNKKYHRTYKELKRRNCPMLKIFSLNTSVCLNIVSKFLNKSQITSSTLYLNQNQKMKVASNNNTSKPFFLRLILSFLRLEKELSSTIATATSNDHLGKLLESNSIPNLLSWILHYSSLYLFPPSKQQQQQQQQLQQTEKKTDIFSFVLSVLHASRNGLSIEDICGLVHFKFRVHFTAHEIHKLERILQDHCIKVHGYYIYAHFTMQDAIFDLYISNSSANLQLHNTMAEYYKESQIVCVKKLSCIVWHLEVSAAWKKLKNVLIDVEHFYLWWNKGDRNEFIELWASLTESKQRQQQKRQDRNCSGGYKLVTGIFRNKWMYCDKRPRPDRPSYDLVEQYSRSLCTYWSKKADCFDAFLHIVVLNMADFLLDFAVLGFERSAHVPSFLHPSVSNEVMQKIGVPYIELEDGLSVFLFPTNNNGNFNKIAEKEDKVVVSTSFTNHNACSASATTNTPMADTAYFFCRWIWIYFPLIALGNINSLKRVILKHLESDEIEKLDETEENVCDNNNVQDIAASENLQKIRSNTSKYDDYLSLRCVKNSEDKPDENQITFTSKAPVQKITMKKSFRQRTSSSSKILMNAQDYAIKKEQMIRLLSKVKNEYDKMVQTKKKLIKQKKDIEKEYDKDNNSDKSNKYLLPQNKSNLTHKRLENTKQNYLQEEVLNKKYCEILKYCQENPANDRGLVRKLESKVSMDSELIFKFEEILHKTNGDIIQMNRNCQSIKRKLFKTKELYHTLIENRLQQRWNLERASNPYPNNRVITTGTSSVASDATAISSSDVIKRNNLKAKNRNSNLKSTKVTIVREEKYQVMEDEIRIKTSDGILSLKQFQSRLLDKKQVQKTKDMIQIKETMDKRMMALRAILQGKNKELEQTLFENENHQACSGIAIKAKAIEEISTKQVSSLSKKQVLRLQKSVEITDQALGAIRCSLENIIGKIKGFLLPNSTAFKKTSRLSLLEMVKEIERGVIHLLKLRREK